MNWLEENARDEHMLRSLDMSLLSQEIVAHGDGLTELVGEHNSRLLAMSERHGRIVDGRKRLADFSACCDGTVDDLLTEQSRLLRETWGWLQDVRVAVVQREALLHKAQDAIGSLLSGRSTSKPIPIVARNTSSNCWTTTMP